MGIFDELLSVAEKVVEQYATSYFTHPNGSKVRVGALKRDEPDPSAPVYDATKYAAGELPPMVDLRPHMSPVENQGDIGSCTGNALAGALEYLENRIGGSFVDISRLFIYWNERELAGETDKDEGARIANGIKSLKEKGACSEITWPYDASKDGRIFQRPHDDAYNEAARHTIDEAHKVAVNVDDMRHCLAEGYPIVIGVEIYRSFEKDGHHGRISMPAEGEKCEGGHAMCVVGYSDTDRVFIVRNSWGEDWGDGGYCYFPYDYMGDPQYGHDYWTIRKAHNLDFGQGVGGQPMPPHTNGKRSLFGDVVNAVTNVAPSVISGGGGNNPWGGGGGTSDTPIDDPWSSNPTPSPNVSPSDNPWGTTDTPVDPATTTTDSPWGQDPAPATNDNPWGTTSTDPSTDPANTWATDDNQTTATDDQQTTDDDQQSADDDQQSADDDQQSADDDQQEEVAQDDQQEEVAQDDSQDAATDDQDQDQEEVAQEDPPQDDTTDDTTDADTTDDDTTDDDTTT